MKIHNPPSLLTYEEKAAIKKAKTFMRRNVAGCVIVTDNSVWWYCSDPEGAVDYLIKNGAIQILFSENL